MEVNTSIMWSSDEEDSDHLSDHQVNNFFRVPFLMFQGPLLFIVDKVGQKILNMEMVVGLCACVCVWCGVEV
jgi:hypothetical protein